MIWRWFISFDLKLIKKLCVDLMTQEEYRKFKEFFKKKVTALPPDIKALLQLVLEGCVYQNKNSIPLSNDSLEDLFSDFCIHLLKKNCFIDKDINYTYFQRVVDNFVKDFIKCNLDPNHFGRTKYFSLGGSHEDHDNVDFDTLYEENFVLENPEIQDVEGIISSFLERIDQIFTSSEMEVFCDILRRRREIFDRRERINVNKTAAYYKSFSRLKRKFQNLLKEFPEIVNFSDFDLVDLFEEILKKSCCKERSKIRRRTRKNSKN
ncbi:MAG: hypothetical protein ABIM20_06510 [candidate division WOR-3 bacterium]